MKIMHVELVPENVTRVVLDQRFGWLTFETTIKGPAGSTIHVELPYTAQVEAAAALTGAELRARALRVDANGG